jgi:hypothetical protein
VFAAVVTDELVLLGNSPIVDPGEAKVIVANAGCRIQVGFGSEPHQEFPGSCLHHNCIPIGAMILRLNRFLCGWANYFSTGYPWAPFRQIDDFVRDRLIRHLQRRSQGSFQPPQDANWN